MPLAQPFLIFISGFTPSMLTIQEFRTLLTYTGEPVAFATAKEPVQTANLIAIIQPVNTRDEGLLNSYGVGARTIQMAAADLPIAPVKFDSVTAQGERLVIDTVISQHTRGTGVISYFLCYCKGK